jgi:ABC-type lipoprotein export system ATPase subunit
MQRKAKLKINTVTEKKKNALKEHAIGFVFHTVIKNFITGTNTEANIRVVILFQTVVHTSKKTTSAIHISTSQ